VSTPIPCGGSSRFPARFGGYPVRTKRRQRRICRSRFLFRRSVVFTAEDKQAEFATRFGKISVKARFILRDMLVRGKLEL